jgi:hypothetical protein
MLYHIDDIRSHEPHTLAWLERVCGAADAWPAAAFVRFLRDARSDGLVAIRRNEPIGHLLWRRHRARRHMYLLRLGVRPEFRWPALAGRLVEAMLHQTMAKDGEPPVTWGAIVDDDRLDWHLLLRDFSFGAIHVIRRGGYANDAYVFHRHHDPAPALTAGAWQWRDITPTEKRP